MGPIHLYEKNVENTYFDISKDYDPIELNLDEVHWGT